jgi:hypothetical protein
MEPLHVQDQVFQLKEGWFCVNRGRVHGTFATEAHAWRDLEARWRADLDLSRQHRGYLCGKK